MKNLIQEIHRRSLWQVLGIYLAGAWLMLQFVDTLAGALGLPDWSASLALFLLIVGLPIVLATAFVQQGMTTKEPEPEPESLAGAGESPAPLAAEPAAHHRLFTWRNAIRGGVVAFALLGILTAGYLFLRSAGIGPAGTLVAQGVLEEGAEVVLANFDSADADLAEVVTGALRIDLVQSPVIKLVSTSQLSRALRRMQRHDDAPITGELARELATREGYGAVIEGDIGTLGSGYVVTASILGGEEWEPLAAFRATAKSEDDLIDAIESLSRDIRDKAGESLRSVQQSPGLTQVTTASLEALRIYTRAEAMEIATGVEEGTTELYERAIEIDPDFAMAHRKLSVNLSNRGIRRSDAVTAATRALELRDRLPEIERYLAEAHYATRVTGDRDAGIRAYQNLLEIDPTNRTALNNLGVIYRARGPLEEALSMFERAVNAERLFVAYRSVSNVRYMLGDRGAAATLDTAIGLFPDGAAELEISRVEQALALAQYGPVDSLLVAYRERFTRPRDRAGVANYRFLLAVVRGRAREAEGQFDESRFSNPLRLAIRRARMSNLRGNETEAARVLLEALDQHRDALAAGDRFYPQLITILVAAGDPAAAQRVADEWTREIPETQLGVLGSDARRVAAATLAHAAGDLEEAEGLWQLYERECPHLCGHRAAVGLALMHDQAGDAASAIAEYERYLAIRYFLKGSFDAWERPPALERLGQLYDEQNDLENAAKYYAMFVELWAEADEELQPRVRGAQARLEAILTEIG